MGHLSRTVDLTTTQAAKLLAKKIEGIVVTGVKQIAYTNDVFRVATERHGNYYVKFYTARWYKGFSDMSGMVYRELAAHHVLTRRGIALPYDIWGDFSCDVVNEAVLVSSELPGISLPVVIRKHPQDEPRIWETIGRYLRRIHEIPFATPTALGQEHIRALPPTGTIPCVGNPDEGNQPSDRAAQRQADAIAALDKALEKNLLPQYAAAALRILFDKTAGFSLPEFEHPCFAVQNIHDHHFHLVPSDTGWEVNGLYDFEGAAATDPHVDLVDLDMTVTSNRRSYAWREPFCQGYGRMRCFESFKITCLSYLIGELEDPQKKMVPDKTWLDSQWKVLAGAKSLEEFRWFPTVV